MAPTMQGERIRRICIKLGTYTIADIQDAMIDSTDRRARARNPPTSRVISSYIIRWSAVISKPTSKYNRRTVYRYIGEAV